MRTVRVRREPGDPPLSKSFPIMGWVLDDWIDSHRLSQREIAKKIRISEGYLCNLRDRHGTWEKWPSYRKIKLITRFFGKKPYDLIDDPEKPYYTCENHLWTLLEQRACHEYIVLHQTARKISAFTRREIAREICEHVRAAVKTYENVIGSLKAVQKSRSQAPLEWSAVYKQINSIYERDDSAHLACCDYHEEKTTFRQHLKAGDGCQRTCRRNMMMKYRKKREKALSPEAAADLESRLTRFVEPSLSYHTLVAKALEKEMMPVKKLWLPLKNHVLLLARLVFEDTNLKDIFGDVAVFPEHS